MKQGSNITNLTGFKDVLILISTLHYSDFFHVTFGEEIISRRNFFKINLTIHDSKIKEIYLCDSIGSEFHFCDWFLLLLDFYYRLTPDSFSKELIFMRKSSTHFLKLLRRIFNYFSKITFSEFCKKELSPDAIISVLDLIKTSVQGTPKNNFLPLNTFAKSSIVNVKLGSEYVSELSIKYFSNYNDRSTNVSNQKTNVFFDE